MRRKSEDRNADKSVFLKILKIITLSLHYYPYFMDEKTKIGLLSKLISWNDILKQLKDRKKEYYTESIPKHLIEKYINDGWSIETEFKNTIRLKKDKPIDVAFEDCVWSLFAQFWYTFLNKDRHFSLPYDKHDPNNAQQIDVFAKEDETILLVECKTAQENKRWDFKKELEAMTSKIQWLKNSVKALFPDGKYKIKFIFATKNLFLSEEDTQRLKNIWWIHFNEDNLSYFLDLYSQLWDAAKYQLLGYLFDKEEIPEIDNKVPAIEWTMGGYTYYSFSIEPEKILKIWYVLHRNNANMNMMPTYQRLIKKSRLKSVESFIENWGYFPNSIVISLDESNLTFERANTKSNSTISRAWILHLPKKYRSAYIIDWQHRLYWYSNSKYKNTNTIPVVAFLKLSRKEQIKVFMQINENQKAVSKNLRNTLNSDLLWNSDNYTEQMKALCSRVSISLWENRDSPLYDKVSIWEDNKIITSQAIENALKKSGMLGKVSKHKIDELWTIYNGNLDQTFEKLIVYLKSGIRYISENTETDWNSENSMLLINKGIYWIIMILGDLLVHLNSNKTIDSRKDTIKNIFQEVKIFLDPIILYVNEVDFETKESLKKLYWAGWEVKYWRTFQQVIQNTYLDFKPTWLDEYILKEEKRYNDEAFWLIRDIEQYFKTDFKERLEEYFWKKWFDKGLPPKTSSDAYAQASSKNREIDDDSKEIHPWDCITIIAYREIAVKNWQNIFEKEYTKPWEEKWNVSKEEKTKWMQKLERIRNQNSHSYSVSEEELAFLHEIHDWVVLKKVRNKYQLKVN